MNRTAESGGSGSAREPGSHQDRDRAEGWRHAKRSGHDRETLLASCLQTDPRLASWLHVQCFGTPQEGVARVGFEGISATWVPSVLGDKTPRKVDLEVSWSDGCTARVSVKKSESGQVWLVGCDRFFSCFEAQFDHRVPDAVQRAVELFVGSRSPNAVEVFLEGRDRGGPKGTIKVSRQEKRQGRFVAQSLQALLPAEWEETLDWLRRELPRLADLCFSRGLCKEPEAWAEFLWYHILDEADGSRDPVENLVIRNADIVRSIEALPLEARVQVGPKNGGSTLILPFGFLQMHAPHGDNRLQFHHQLTRLRGLLRGVEGR